MGRESLVVLLFAVLLGLGASAASPHKRALIIGLDGTTGSQLHFQTLLQKKAPHLESLMLTGKFAPCLNPKDPQCARSHNGRRTGRGFEWLTGPGWCSVLTGVDNSKHRVKNNSDKELSRFTLSSLFFPSFMKVLNLHGFKTAAGGVSAFMTAKKYGAVAPGIIDYECGKDKKHRPLIKASAPSSCNLTERLAQDGNDDNRDTRLAQFMKAEIENPEIDLVMGVFDKIDSAGHWNGFSNNQSYLAAISAADELIGSLIKAIEFGVSQRSEEWLVIVTSDHGGHNVLMFGDHGTVNGYDDQIPFIIKTFGSTLPLKELTSPVTHMDVHPTVLRWFGVEPLSNLDGHIQGI